MAINTQITQLHDKCMLFSEPAELLDPLLTRNNLTSSEKLKGCAGAFLESLAHTETKGFVPFIEAPLKPAPSADEEWPYWTAGATCTEDSISDISYFIRTLMPESVPTEAVGVTTGENVFQGAWAAIKAASRFQAARKIDDVGGMLEGSTDVIRGVTQSAGGAAYLGYRGVMIAADINYLDTTAGATTSVGKSAFILGTIGNLFFTVFYVMLALWSAYGLAKNCQFSAQVKAKESSDTALFAFLMQKVQADPKAKLKKLGGYWKTLPLAKFFRQFTGFKEKLCHTALEVMAEQFLHLQKALLAAGKLEGKKPLSNAETKEVLKALFAIKDSELRKSSSYATYLASLGLSPRDVEGFDFSMLELIGFKLEEMKRGSRKSAKISRVTDDGCVAAITKAASRGLSERLSSSDALIQASAQKEISELKGRISVENKNNQFMHSALLISGVLGVALSILGFFAIPPVGVIALTAATLLLCIAMGAADGYCMAQGWDSGAPGRYDKEYLVAISLVLVAALAVSVGVTLGFGLPLMPLILAFVIGGMGLALAGVAYFKLVRKEKKWIEDHPTLSIFQQHLDTQIALSDDTALDEKTTALFKKLPKAQRKAVREKYFNMAAQGELGLRTAKYQALDTYHHFGCSYLFDQISSKGMSDAKEQQLYIRGLKKTLKMYWNQWENAKTEENKQVALKMQAFIESVVQKEAQDIHKKLGAVLAIPGAYSQLEKDLWYVAKRQESKADLKQVVGAVLRNLSQ